MKSMYGETQFKTIPRLQKVKNDIKHKRKQALRDYKEQIRELNHETDKHHQRLENLQQMLSGRKTGYFVQDLDDTGAQKETLPVIRPKNFTVRTQITPESAYNPNRDGLHI